VWCGRGEGFVKREKKKGLEDFLGGPFWYVWQKWEYGAVQLGVAQIFEKRSKILRNMVGGSLLRQLLSMAV